MTVIVTGALTNILADAIVLILQKLVRVRAFNKFWSLFVILFLAGAVVGFNAYPSVFPKQIPCEKLGTSEELTTSAWKAFVKNDFSRALECTEICINRRSEKAKEQQQEFSQRGGIAVTDNIPKYWALNDVSTYWFIRGEVYRKMRGNEKARKAYQEIVDNYNYGRY